MRAREPKGGAGHAVPGGAGVLGAGVAAAAAPALAYHDAPVGRGGSIGGLLEIALPVVVVVVLGIVGLGIWERKKRRTKPRRGRRRRRR